MPKIPKPLRKITAGNPRVDYIHGCLGCERCKKYPSKCVQKDDLTILLQEMTTYDALSWERRFIGIVAQRSFISTEHLSTGYPIVYTSADSVFQIAAIEQIVPLDKLYEYGQSFKKDIIDECL